MLFCRFSTPEFWVPSLRVRFTIHVAQNYERLFTLGMVLGNILNDVEEEGGDTMRGVYASRWSGQGNRSRPTPPLIDAQIRIVKAYPAP